MNISDERMGALAKEIAEALVNERVVTADDPQHVAHTIRQALVRYVQGEAVMDQKARTKLASLKRGVVEGSREWDILYQKYYEEELNKTK